MLHAAVILIVQVVATNAVLFANQQPYSAQRLKVSPTDFYISKRVVYNQNADLMIGAVMPVTDKGRPNEHRTCTVRDSADLQVLEALFYTLDLINSKQRDYPFTLGTIILDSCADADFAAIDAYRFISPTLILRYSPLIEESIEVMNEICPNATTIELEVMSKRRYKPVVGIIGSLTSDESAQMANIIRMAQIPQISHGATSFDMSDPKQYPYFLRTIPSDKYGIKAAVSVLIAFNWTYVSVVYDDSMYSLKSFSVLEDIVERRGDVCLAATEKIETQAYNFNRTLSVLRSSQARAVVVLSTLEVTKSFFEYLCAENAYSEFVWIGLCTWTGRIVFQLPDKCDLYKHSLGVVAQSKNLPNFQLRYTSIRPSHCPDCNPWMTQYFELTCNCLYKSILNRTNCVDIENECAERIFGNYVQDPYVGYVSSAALAFAEGLKKIYMDSKNCPMQRNFSEAICDAMSAENLVFGHAGEDLTRILRNITFLDAYNNTFHFVNGIDGPPAFSIYYFDQSNWQVAGECICQGELFEKKDLLKFTDERFLATRLAFFQNVTSACSSKCSFGQFAVFPNPLEPCCWTCVSCDENSIVVSSGNITGENSRQLQESRCQRCASGWYPDEQKLKCVEYSDNTISTEDWYWQLCASSAIVGLLLTGATAGIYWKYRETPIILASDHACSYTILFACMLTFSSTFVFLAPPSLGICSAVRCALGVCLTLAYSSIFAKTLRIMLIFQMPAELPAIMKTRYSVAFLTLMPVGLEVILVMMWLILKPPGVTTQYDLDSHQKETCCETLGPECTIAIALPFLLALVTALLAFRIRKVPDGFNETKAVSFVIYANLVLLMSLLVPLASGSLPYKVMMASIALLHQLIAFAILCGLFFHKLYTVLLRPEKNTKQAVMTRSRTLSGLEGLTTSRTLSLISQYSSSPRSSLEERNATADADASCSTRSEQQTAASQTAAVPDVSMSSAEIHELAYPKY